MAENRFPSVARMVSYDGDVDAIRKRHAEHLKYYGATDADCELINLRPAPHWDKAKTHYQLRISTYLGWKVYMLHTGCFASIPEYEPK